MFVHINLCLTVFHFSTKNDECFYNVFAKVVNTNLDVNIKHSNIASPLRLNPYKPDIYLRAFKFKR